MRRDLEDMRSPAKPEPVPSNDEDDNPTEIVTSGGQDDADPIRDALQRRPEVMREMNKRWKRTDMPENDASGRVNGGFAFEEEASTAKQPRYASADYRLQASRGSFLQERRNMLNDDARY